MKMFAGIIILVLVLIIYFGYSFLQNQKTQSFMTEYRQFRDIYGDVATTAMGYAKDSVFTKDVTIFLAADNQQRIIDARMINEKDGLTDGSRCDEYIGMSLNKYIDNESHRSDRPYINETPKSAKERAFDMAARKIIEQGSI